MATTATPAKLATKERALITQALNYYHKGSLRAVTTSQEPEIKAIHQQKANDIAALTVKLNNQELDI